jgi:predicted RNase H-like HicB family nuclease
MRQGDFGELDRSDSNRIADAIDYVRLFVSGSASRGFVGAGAFRHTRGLIAGRIFRRERMPQQPLLVTAEWDAEAGVWVATSEDVPGLATEAATVDALMEKLKVMIPELLAENGNPAADEVAFTLRSERHAIASQHPA